MKKYNKRILAFSIISIILLISIFTTYDNNIIKNITSNKDILSYNVEEDFIYLSDLDYINDSAWSYAGYGSIKRDSDIEDGTGIYEFTKNGTYEITFYDQLGNKGSLTVVIDWLD